MQRLFLFLALMILPLSSPSIFGQWIENYYECLCYSGSRTECIKKIDSNHPEYRDFISAQFSSKDTSLWLSQIRAAEIILDQRAQERPEESTCLKSARSHIDHALLFSIKEKMEARPDSFTYIKALHELSREIYQWAEENCFNNRNAPSTPLEINLPNPNLCRPRY